MNKRICAVADLHGFLPEIPDCDILLIAGDIGVTHMDGFGNPDVSREGNFLAYEFAPWLTSLIERHIFPVGIAGNHDFVAERHPDFIRELPWIYLEDSGTTISGLNIWGTPWQPNYCDWAFNAPSGPGGEAFLDEKFSLIPDDTDIVISHTPPNGFHDRIGNNNVGSTSLLKHLRRVGPMLNVCGHIHHGYGQRMYGDTLIANVAVTNVVKGYYKHEKPPMVFDTDGFKVKSL